MKTIKGLGVFALAVVLLASCGTTAHIEKDESTDLSKYKTFTWMPETEKVAAKGTISDLAAQNIKTSVKQELEKNGWKEVTGNADLLVGYDVLVEKNTRVDRDAVYSRPFSRLYYNPYTRRYGTIYYPSQFLGYEENEIPVREGTVTITMIDPKTDKTVWQGWATDEISSNKLTSKDIQRNVRSIFKKFEVE
jgi:hypothetical protein